MQRQVTNKAMEEPIVARYKFEMEKPCIFCLKKRQQSSSAVCLRGLNLTGDTNQVIKEEILV